MQTTENSKRKYFTRKEKTQILMQLDSGGMTHSELARQHGIHPVTIHKWKRQMNEFKENEEIDIEEIFSKNKEYKKENEMLKKALANMAIEKEILQTANEVLKKSQPKVKLNRRKR